VAGPDIIDPFYRRLYPKLEELLGNKSRALALGTARQLVGETRTTGEKYEAEVGYVQAINEIIDICDQLDRGDSPQSGQAQENEG
jgi:hypothetical protein